MSSEILSHALLLDEDIKKCVNVFMNKNTNIVEWKPIDFTKKGDNFASHVTSVKVKIILDNSTYKNEECELSFVAKINPCRPYDNFSEYTNACFKHESIFFNKVLPLLQQTLSALLPFPKYYTGRIETGKEVLYFEDLRQSGFFMYDRISNLGLREAQTIIISLAQLHTSSFLLKKRNQTTDLHHLFPEADEYFLTPHKKWSNAFQNTMENFANTSLALLKKVGHFEKSVKFITNHKKNCIRQCYQQIIYSKEEFQVICHGDCWKNNILFKNNESEIRFLDLQMWRVASVGTDLAYFVYSSLDGNLRRNNLHAILSLYYKTLTETLQEEGYGNGPPFSFDELLQEFDAKSLLAFWMGVAFLPITALQGEDAPDINDGLDSMFREQENKLEKLMSSKNFKKRFLLLFEDMLENDFLQNGLKNNFFNLVCTE